MSNTPLWTADELIDATGGQMIGHWHVNGLDIDSREIEAGAMFVALKAARDGHEFVAAALGNGAAGALVSHIPEGLENAPLLVVDDVEAALRALGHYRREQTTKAKHIAITGSAGKTSTKEMLRHVLTHYGSTHASIRSFNNHWGVPLTLARMPRDTDFGVFEIGMNAPNEIEPLARQVLPDVAVITNIAPVHLEGFENEEGIAVEKASILHALGSNGAGVVFGDIAHRNIVERATSAPIIWYGDCAHSFGRNDVCHRDLVLDAEGSDATIAFENQEMHLRLNVSGAVHQRNAMAVLTVIHQLGLELAPAIAALATWSAPSGRGQIIVKGGVAITDQSFNANPLSMRAALDGFVLQKARRKIVVLGDMHELGHDAAHYHRELASHGAFAQIDRIYTVGDLMRELDIAGLPIDAHFDNADGLARAIFVDLEPGDAIMFKASKGVGLGKTVDQLCQLLQEERG